MSDDDDIISSELEALDYTYGTALRVESRCPLRVVISIEPFTGEDSTKVFVCADLVLSAGKGYPEQAPDIRLQDVKGMGSAVIIYDTLSPVIHAKLFLLSACRS